MSLRNFAAGVLGLVKLKTRGIVPPVFTALLENGQINYDIIPSYAKFYAGRGIKSVLVGDLIGESLCFDLAERQQIMEAWVKAGKEHDIKIMAHVGGAPMFDVLNMTSHYSSIGVSTILTLPELFYPAKTVNELVDYVELVANEAKKLPILYYHYPDITNVKINLPDFVKEATKRIPSFKGLKFKSNNLDQAYNVFRILASDQDIFLGSSIPVAAAAALGMKSFSGATHNLYLGLVKDIISAVDASKMDKAREYQAKLSDVQNTLANETPTVMKAAMEMLTGIKVGPPLQPHKPLSEEARTQLGQGLLSLDIITVT